MVFLTRHEESIKARPWLAFRYPFWTSFWTSSSSSFFTKKLSKFSIFPNLVLLQVKILQKTKVCYIFSFSFLFAKKNSTRTNRLNSFCVSLLPFPKERRTNRLNSFVSPFSLFKRIQKDTVWEFFWFFPFP